MILGELHSKFTYGANTIELPNSIMSFDFDQQVSELKNELTGEIHFVACEDETVFDLFVLLFKYPDPEAKLREIYSFNKCNVVFFPHKDGNALKEKGGTADAKFILSEVYPLYYHDMVTLDMVKLKFKTLSLLEVKTATEEVVGGYGKHYGRNYGKGL